MHHTQKCCSAFPCRSVSRPSECNIWYLARSVVFQKWNLNDKWADDRFTFNITNEGPMYQPMCLPAVSMEKLVESSACNDSYYFTPSQKRVTLRSPTVFIQNVSPQEIAPDTGEHLRGTFIALGKQREYEPKRRPQQTSLPPSNSTAVSPARQETEHRRL